MFHSILVLFAHCLWAVIDVLSVVYLRHLSLTVRRSADQKWHRHLHWINPMLLGSILQLPYRLTENTRYFLNLRTNNIIMDPLDLLLMAGGVLILIGTYRLLQLMRLEIQPMSLVHQAVEEWPQAPDATIEESTQNPWEMK